MMINFLSNNITCRGERGEYMATINSLKGLRSVCNSKYYRICIEILQKHKLLYVRTRHGKETYMAGERSKQYRWNKTEKELMGMQTVYKHKVTDHRYVKKIMERHEELQCFKYLKDSLVKTNRKCRIYKKKPEKGKTLVETVENWNKYYHGYVEGEIYVTKGKMDLIKNQFKYGYQRLIYNRIGKIINPRLYRRLSLDKVREILADLYGYYRRQPENFDDSSSMKAIPF